MVTAMQADEIQEKRERQDVFWDLYFDAMALGMADLGEMYFMTAFRLGRELEGAKYG